MAHFYKKKTPSAYNEQLIYGRHPVLDALKNGLSVDKVWLSQSVKGGYDKDLREWCKTNNVPLQMVPKDRLDQITRKNHQGVLGWLSHVDYQRIEDIFPTIYDRGEIPLIVVLDGITDVRNMGAIARSAEALGAHALLLPHKKTAQINAEALKTSAGALSTLPVCRTASLGNAVDYLVTNGVQVLAADLSGQEQLQELDWTVPTALILGSEDEGVRPHLMRKATPFLIPMQGSTDSLNVSVAAGICLYECHRQRLLI